MTFSLLWFVVGVAIGVNVTLGYAWLTLRRANRKAARAADAAYAVELRKNIRRLLDNWYDRQGLTRR